MCALEVTKVTDLTCCRVALNSWQDSPLQSRIVRQRGSYGSLSRAMLPIEFCANPFSPVQEIKT